MSVLTGLNREAVYAALFSGLIAQLDAKNGGPFATTSRRYWQSGTMPPEQLPALFFVEAGEIYDRAMLHGPLKVTLVVNLTIQSMLGLDPEAVSATEVNNLADAVDAAVTGLSPSYGSPSKGINTLGGLVGDAFLTGRQVDMISSGPKRFSMQTMQMWVITTQQGWMI